MVMGWSEEFGNCGLDGSVYCLLVKISRDWKAGPVFKSSGAPLGDKEGV